MSEYNKLPAVIDDSPEGGLENSETGVSEKPITDSTVEDRCGACPVCGEPLESHLTHESTDSSDTEYEEHLPIDPGEEVIQCPRCDTSHHQECWDYNEGCAIYGCKASLTLAREAAEIQIGVSEELITPHTFKESVRVNFLKSVHFLSMFSDVHWYVGGVSLSGSCILVLAKFLGRTASGNIPIYAIYRTIAFHGLLIGFLVLLLARFLPAFLKSFGTYGPSYQIKLPSDYTPKEIDALVVNKCKNVNVFELAAFLHYSQGSFERAEELFSQGLAIDADHQNCTYQLGRCQVKLGRLDSALEKFIHGWEINKHSSLGKKSKWWADLIERRIANGGAKVPVPVLEKKYLK